MERCRNIKDIFDGIVLFIDSKASFESNEAINDTIKTIESSNSLEMIFRYPINNRIFSFQTSLEWLFFIQCTIQYISEEAIAIPSTFDISFSINDAFIFISNIYDTKKEDLLDYFNQSDSDEEED